MIYRQLGKTGERVSFLGLGGSHIGQVKPQTEAIKIMHAAIDQGLTFMDNCWDYHDGRSEVVMGKALAQSGYRKKVFLMSKIDGRDKKNAAKQIDESLKRLKTDCVDLMQLHEIIRIEDPDRIFAKGGAIEAMIEAKQAGKIRLIGFTGHKDPLIHLRMLEVAQANNFHFDTAQMPINVMDAHFRSFLKQVVPVCLEQGIGVLGMKSLGSGDILSSKVVKAKECLRFSLSQPVSVQITGIDSMQILNQALEVAKDFTPLTQDETDNLLERTAAAAHSGHFEKFKTGSVFDGTAQNPEWLGEAA